MQAAGSRASAYLAAAILTLITLTIFYILREYGPDKAIQRFHEAALSGDQLEISRVILQPLGTTDSKGELQINPDVRTLENAVVDITRAGGRPVVQRIEGGPTEMVFWIDYEIQGPHVTIHWVVDLGSYHRWLVNVDKTLDPNFPLGD